MTYQQYRNKHLVKDLITIFAVLAIIIICSIRSTAQTPPVKPPEKPQFKPDFTVPLTTSVNLSAGQVSDYLFVLQSGGPEVLSTSDKLSGAQITASIRNYRAVMDSVSSRLYKSFIGTLKAQQDKFTADTLKQYHTKK